MFSATCGPGEVVVIASARYGRMRLGRCVRKDLGYIGCYQDVLHLTDKRCSGRNACQIRIPDPEFDMTRPCLEELKTYFEVTYSCVKVWLPAEAGCQSTNNVILTAASGTLSSHVTSESGCGSPSHPYMIRALPGQQINLTLADFMINKPTGALDHGSRDDAHCRAYAVLVDSYAKRREVICGGRERVRHVYLSSSNELELRVTPSSGDSVAHFLFSYEVLGCADLEVGEEAWMQRTRDGATVGCRESEQTWSLTCVGATWTGMIGNCSHHGIFESDTHNGPPARMSYGTSIVVILVIAFLIGVIVFVIGFISFKRCPKKSGPNGRRVPTYIRGDQERAMVEMDEKTGQIKRKADTLVHGPGCRLAKIDGNDYAHIWETTLPLTHTHTLARDVGESAALKHERRMSQPEICPLETNLDLIQPTCLEHRETMPRLKRRPGSCDLQHDGPTVPRYFVLDKEAVLMEDPSSCTHLLHSHHGDRDQITFIPHPGTVQPSHVDMKPHPHDLTH